MDLGEIDDGDLQKCNLSKAVAAVEVNLQQLS